MKWKKTQNDTYINLTNVIALRVVSPVDSDGFDVIALSSYSYGGKILDLAWFKTREECFKYIEELLIKPWEG